MPLLRSHHDASTDGSDTIIYLLVMISDTNLLVVMLAHGTPI